MNIAVLMLAAVGAGGGAGDAAEVAEIRVGSKAFTESIVLGELAAVVARSVGNSAENTELGGTQVVWAALQNDELDVYAEYTGTLWQEILQRPPADRDALLKALARHNVAATAPLGFNNTYGLGMTVAEARRRGVRRISDLAGQRNLRFGFSNEFRERPDGWPGLRGRYRLTGDVTGMEHTLSYKALAAGDLDVVDIYSTDADVAVYDLEVLEDDLQFFPRYDAIFLYRRELETTAPEFVAALRGLEGKIDDDAMRLMNRRVQVDGEQEPQVAASFAAAELGLVFEGAAASTLWSRVWETTVDHSWLVLVSLSAAIAVAVPLGVVAAHRPLLGQVIVGVAEVVQTIPGLALLVLLGSLFRRIGQPTIGFLPVVVALFLYSLLPILRNTMTGLRSIPQGLRESAEVLGLTRWDKLWRIELPLAAGMILAGVKTTAVINVGYATLGGLIGAGGYGQPILSGLRRNSELLMLEGAVPAALMALAVKWLFELAEKRLVTPS